MLRGQRSHACLLMTPQGPTITICNLLIQAGLIEGTEHQVPGGAPARFLLIGLTWQGHEFLAVTADQDLWSWFKKSAGTTLASIPFPVITKLLVDGAEEAVRPALQSHGFLI
jgi:hypothetical protein